tara:strand:- start:1109 stop:1909 length:801 start_codon:yes stop_codon:yes gene_type:complete
LEKEFSKNLISRVPIALLMAAIIILALAYGNSLLIKIFILAITILAALELLNFIGRSIFNILFLVSALVGVLFLQENIKVFLAIFGFYFWFGTMILMVLKQLPRLKKLMPYMMIIFLSLFLSSGILISSSQLLPINGNLLLFMVILNTALIDIGAYLSGNLFGKNKIFPLMSPNKTAEGLIGGSLISIIFISSMFILNFISQIVFLAILASIPFTFVGDLFESYLKRVSDVKDSSSLLLGHGGFLDRIDSHLPAFTTVAGILFLSS